MIYMFLSNNPSSGDINSSNLSCFFILLGATLKGKNMLPIELSLIGHLAYGSIGRKYRYISIYCYFFEKHVKYNF